MKVLIMNPILYTSETDEIPKVSSIKDTMIYTLCCGFIENGDEPVLVAADAYKPVVEEQYPFQIVWLPCMFPQICKPRCFPCLKGLGKYLREHGEEFEYIISSEVFSLLTLCGAFYAKEKLLIWHELGAHNNIFKKLPSKFWYHIIARLFLQDIPIIPRSQRAREFIEQYSNRVLDVTIDHGVDLDKIKFSRKKENYFVVVSQLIERKHIDGILYSFSKFYQRGNGDYQLKIIGDGILKNQLEELVKQLDMTESIIFMGKLDHEHMMPILANAKALLINTSKDNSMVSIVESIGAGTPVITTTVPFNAAYIRRSSLGIVEDQWGAEALEQICTENNYYVENCIAYREKLSNMYCAKQFDDVGGMLR
ncbi:MAG: glycosyltransferase [Clostridiales bacterium]|nr:glycosyltransferase [Clostridiales bacterium]